jgi:OOP family OmpA-OmpF porin
VTRATTHHIQQDNMTHPFHMQGFKQAASAAVAGLFVAFAPLSAAQAQSAPSVYLGATVGVSNFQMDCDGYRTCDQDDTGVKVYGGYRFWRGLAVEVGYIDFGKASVQSYYVYGPLSIEAHATTVAASYQLDFTQNFAGIGRAGVANVTAKETWQTQTASSTKFQPYLGLGLSYAFTPHLRGVVSIDLSHGEVDFNDGSKDEGNLSLFSVGLQANF